MVGCYSWITLRCCSCQYDSKQPLQRCRVLTNSKHCMIRLLCYGWQPVSQETCALAMMAFVESDQYECACAMQAAHEFAQGVKKIDGLEVVGEPDMCVVAIKSTSKQLNIYKLNDLMSQRGWHLNALQFPSSVHMCFTAQHTEVVPQLLKVIAALALTLEIRHADAYFSHNPLPPRYCLSSLEGYISCTPSMLCMAYHKLEINRFLYIVTA